MVEPRDARKARRFTTGKDGERRVGRRTNYGFEKRQRELKKQKKKEAKAEKKRLRKEEEAMLQAAEDGEGMVAPEPGAEEVEGSEEVRE